MEVSTPIISIPQAIPITLLHRQIWNLQAPIQCLEIYMGFQDVQVQMLML